MIKDEEIRAIYNQGPEAVIALVKNLFQGFELQVAVLEARIKHLENRINTNSRKQRQAPFQRWTCAVD